MAYPEGMEGIVVAPVYGPTFKLTATDASDCTGHSAGTITLIEGSKAVVGDGTTFTAAMVGLALVVNGRYIDHCIVETYTNATSITVSKTSHRIVGAGLSYEICLVPDSIYRCTCKGGACFIKHDIVSCTAVDDESDPERENIPFDIYTWKKHVYVAVIIEGGTGTVDLFMTRLLS